jgi:riboflavin kinase/FMN adenylyltransferase
VIPDSLAGVELFLDPAPGELGDRGRAVAIGTFDGVHRGHARLIEELVARSRAAGLAATVLSFDRHPLSLLAPDKVPPQLCSPAEKVALMEMLGVDAVALFSFTPELSALSPAEFAAEILVNTLQARLVLVGEDFRFGHRRAGDVPLLTELGVRFGFEVEGLALARIQGNGAGSEPVVASSTRIREALLAGETGLAARLLGRPFALSGRVVTGDRRGRELGFATANLEIEPDLLIPAEGIYGGIVRQPAASAAISVGRRPTFYDPSSPEATRLVEVHLLDFAGDLYGQELTVEFHRRIRGQVRFDSAGDLTAQMARDLAEIRSWSAGSKVEPVAEPK